MKTLTPRERAEIALSHLKKYDFDRVVDDVEKAIINAVKDSAKIAERKPKSGEIFNHATGKAIAAEIRAKLL